MERAAGGKEIKFPCCVMYDNHSSRFDEKVMEALYGPAAELGFEPFFEKSLTSQFLQMLDQINKACHDHYKKGKKEYKKQHKAKYGEEPDIGVPEFLEILGGCLDLNLAGIWFSWVSRTTIVGAWRKVGVLSRTTDGSQINRKGFVDRVVEEREADTAAALPAPSPGRQTRLKRSLAELTKTPPGVRSGSAAAADAKIKALSEQVLLLQEENKRVEALPFDPAKVPGLLEYSSNQSRTR